MTDRTRDAKQRRRRLYVILILALFGSLIVAAVIFWPQPHQSKIEPAPLFTTRSVTDEEVPLTNYSGRVVVLSFMWLESTTCTECKEHNIAQIDELRMLRQRVPEDELSIITVSYSDHSEAASMVARYDIDWEVISDPQMKIYKLYQEYWSDDTGLGFYNPTLLLIDPELDIVAAYHISTDGVQSAAALNDAHEAILEGRWGAFRGTVSNIDEVDVNKPVAFATGLFGLGLLTTLSPCSIVVLIALVSLILTKGPEKDGTERNKSADTKRGAMIGIMFMLGMAVVFFIFGLFISYAGGIIARAPLFYLISGFLLILLGVNNFVPIIDSIHSGLRWLRKKGRSIINGPPITPGTDPGTDPQANSWSLRIGKRLLGRSVPFGSFVLGIFFAFVLAPCAISLVLPVFIIMMGQDLSVLMSGVLFFIFGVGHGLPVIPLTTVTSTARMRFVRVFTRLGRYLVVIFGLAIITIGVLFAIRFWGVILW